MTLYVRTLIIEDEDNQTILKVSGISAKKALSKALNILRLKEGPRSLREIIQDFKRDWKAIDKEFKEYFN